MSPPTASPSNSSQWHSVTPQTRPLSIAILELAPTSVTLALTRSPPTQASGSHNLTPAQHVVHSLAHSHHLHAHSHQSSGQSSSANCNSKKKKKRRNAQMPDSDDGDDEDDSGSGSHVPGAYPSLLGEGQTFKDMLSHGVVVTLDGMPWSRIVAHVSDDADEEDGAQQPTEDHDEEGDWEDDWDGGGNDEEAVVSASGASHPAARRRRGHRQSATENRGATRPAKTLDKAERGPRWDRERAVVVVYDLDPSKEHEIELQIVGLAGEIKEGLVPVSNAVLIPPASPNNNSLHPRSRANSLRSRSRPRSRSNSVNTQAVGSSPLAGEPSSPSRSSTPTPDPPVIPTSILSPHDAQTAQTRHLIAAAHAERELLQVQIKEARKTAQRSEAALRTEIESMKKSSEKAGSNDQRNKQKYLALQEQVKQGWAGAESANKETEEVKNSMPELEKRLKAVKADLAGVHGEWEQVKQKEDDAREADKKDRAEDDKKLVDISNKVDKMRTKKERKEAEQADLQKRLEELGRQKEEVERKAEEEKNMRRQGYYPAMWNQQQGISHPSTSNLGAGGANFRPRGGFQSRFPSGGRPPTALPSPTVTGGFFPNESSSNWNAPKATPSGSRVSSGLGPNPTAAVFRPSNAQLAQDPNLHTALTPPQFQHRIYLPNGVRPRPTPNFHPPPSVLAEQAAQAAASSSSGSSPSLSPPQPQHRPSPLIAPAFPPLSTQSQPTRPSAPGPSLASIVTRAVLAPTSALASAPSGSNATMSAAPGAGRPHVSPPMAHVTGPQQRGEFPPLSPTAGLGFNPQVRVNRSTPTPPPRQE